MYKVTAYVADGSLVCQHPDVDVERILGREVQWTPNDDRQEAGKFYQQSYTTEITAEEAERLTGVENIYIQDLTAESIQRGLDDVANGNVSSLGSFSQYADIEIDD